MKGKGKGKERMKGKGPICTVRVSVRSRRGKKEAAGEKASDGERG